MKPTPCVLRHAQQSHALKHGSGRGGPWALFLGVALWGVGPTASAATHYVDLSNPTPTAPYTTWATAATTIQDAVDAAAAGDEIVVTNGTYSTGGKPLADFPLMTNRVTIDKALRVRSVNGPLLTVIAGQPAPSAGNRGDGAIRCAYVAAGAVLSGFTLTNGHTRGMEGDWAKEQRGGGAQCERGGVLTNCTLTANSADFGGGAFGGTLNNCTLMANSAADGGGAGNCTLNNCILTSNSADYGGGAAASTLNNCLLRGNSASQEGGGAYRATLNNTTLTGNSAESGGGAAWGTLSNCTLTGNSARDEGGGANGGTLNNCIIYYNAAPNGANYHEAAFAYSCATPLPAGEGNIDADPLLASATHLSAQSPGVGRGSPAYTRGVDIDGEPWLDPPCMGADQLVPGAATGPLTLAITATYSYVASGFAVSFVAENTGPITGSAWDFGDGVVVSNRPYASHAWVEPGHYPVRLTGYNDSHPEGVSATLLVQVAAREAYCVNATNASPMYPYTNWAGAAVTIQEAIDAGTQGGRLVLVSDGVYASGGRAVFGTMTNRVVVPAGVEVRSVNGRSVTVIAGQPRPGTTNNGDGAIRCVYVGAGALVSGFTLTNGHTRTDGDNSREPRGGAAWCESSGVLTNCVLTDNSANYGGGVAYGTLNDCTLTRNSADYGGGADRGTLNNCTLTGNSAGQGGGAFGGALNNCTLTGNSARSTGGGAAWSMLNNCTLRGNSAGSGGGATGGTLDNCTLTGNSAAHGGGSSGARLNNCTLTGNSASKEGGGTWYGILRNCIVYYNTAPNGANHYTDFNSTFAYSCTTPLPSGEGNIASEPLFVDTNGWSNLRLQPNSPCLNSGNNAYAVGATDLDGNPRISGGTVDMGAYELQSLDPFHAWLGQYGLPTDGSADFTDSDGDGHNNWQEWLAGSVPIEAGSVLRIVSVSDGVSGLTVSWASVTDRTYALEVATDLGVAPAFSLVHAEISGLPGTTTWTDTNAVGAAPRFYRVRLD